MCVVNEINRWLVCVKHGPACLSWDVFVCYETCLFVMGHVCLLWDVCLSWDVLVCHGVYLFIMVRACLSREVLVCHGTCLFVMERLFVMGRACLS